MHRIFYEIIFSLFLITCAALSSCRKDGGLTTNKNEIDRTQTIKIPIVPLRAQDTNNQLNTDNKDKEDQVKSLQVVSDFFGTEKPVTSSSYYNIPETKTTYAVPFILFTGYAAPSFIANLPKGNFKRTELIRATDPTDIPSLDHLVPPFVMSVKAPIISVDKESSPIVIREGVTGGNSAPEYNQILLERTVASVDVRVRNEYSSPNSKTKNIELYRMEVKNIPSKIILIEPLNRLETKSYLTESEINNKQKVKDMYNQTAFEDYSNKLQGFSTGDLDKKIKRIYLPENKPKRYTNQTFIKLYFRRLLPTGNYLYKSFSFPVGENSDGASSTNGIIDTSKSVIHDIKRNRNYQYTLVIKEWEQDLDLDLILKTYFVDWKRKNVDNMYFE